MSVFSTVTLICFYSGYSCSHLLLHISRCWYPQESGTIP